MRVRDFSQLLKELTGEAKAQDAYLRFIGAPVEVQAAVLDAAKRLVRMETVAAGIATVYGARNGFDRLSRLNRELTAFKEAASAHFAAEDERLGPAKQGETDEI